MVRVVWVVVALLPKAKVWLSVFKAAKPNRLAGTARDAHKVKELVVLSKARASMFCSSVLRLPKSKVTVFPSLIAKVMVLFALKAEAAKVCSSVFKAAKLIVWLVPPVMPTVVPKAKASMPTVKAAN